MASETQECHLERHDFAKVYLSMAGETLESHPEGHDIVKVCLSMAVNSRLKHPETVETVAQIANTSRKAAGISCLETATQIVRTLRNATETANQIAQT